MKSILLALLLLPVLCFGDGTVSIFPASDDAKIISPLSAFGDLQVAELSPLFQASFEYTVDNTEITTNTVVNGGTVTQASGMAIVGTSTTTASTARLESKQHARYKSGLGGLDRFTALFTTPVAATEQYIGLADEPGSSAAFKNGYMIGFDGTTFGFHRFQNDVKISINKTDWDDPLNGSGKSGIDLDETKLSVWFIAYQYLGAGAIFLFFEDPASGMPILVHTIPYSGLFIIPSTFNPNFHHQMFVNNKATTTDLIVKSASYGYFVQGKTKRIELHQPLQSSGIKQKTAITTEVAIFTIRNKTSYQSKTNFIDIELEGLSAAIEASAANNLGSVRIIKNATLGGTPAFTDINTANSVVEIDVAGTTVTGGVELIPFSLAGKNDAVHAEIVGHNIIINPGESVTLAGSSANSATIDAAMLWRELF